MSIATHLRRGSTLWIDGGFWSCFFMEQISTGSYDPLIGLQRVPLCKRPKGKRVTYKFLRDLLDLELFGRAIMVMEGPDGSLPVTATDLPVAPNDGGAVADATVA